MSSTSNPIAALEQVTGSRWPAISDAAAAASAKRRALIDELTASKLVPPDSTFVMFGSLARNEVTAGSDLDWTLLVDGQCNTQHLDVTKAIKALVEKTNKPPGPTAVFGTMAFSHELVHLIGGEADTNRNTTRRILLLLESRGMVDDDRVRDRVLRNVLKRYLQEDLGYHALHDWRVRVPRFLLNDIVRFWRTMTVDYAAKRRDRGSEGWAIRNFKLRLSRKLIFTAGLAMCMSCELRPPVSLTGAKFDQPADFYAELENYLVAFSNKPPLEVVAEFVRHFQAFDAGRSIFDAYDQFLTIIGNAEKRTQLEQLEVEDAAADHVFQEARAVGTAFQDGLTKLFFGTDENLTKATQRYGVF
jgi:predicted nucleotidyltransferase